MVEDNEIRDHESRTEIDGIQAKLLMGVDESGKKRFLRCDSNGFLLVKAASIDIEELED